MTIYLLVTVLGGTKALLLQCEIVSAQYSGRTNMVLLPEKYQYDAGGSSRDGEAANLFTEQQSYRDTSAKKMVLREYNS